MTLATAPTSSVPSPKKWTCDEYYQLADLGFFQGQHVVLMEGEIIAMPPQKNEHAWAITTLAERFREIFGKGYFIREEKPLKLAADSDPEPDVAVVEGSLQEWRNKPHPSHAALIAEVSDTSLPLDQFDKANLYAAAGILDYWIVNLKARTIEVRRNPVADPSARFGFRYADLTSYHVGETVSPLTKPDSAVAVADILP